MKILQVVKTNRGAAWAFNQAMYLKKLGVEIITVLPDGENGHAAKYKDVGLQVIQGDWSLPVTKPWKLFAQAREIRQRVKELVPDLIHLHFVTNVLMCRLALRKDPTPRLFQVPGPLHLENPITSFAERMTANEADNWAGACNKTCSIYRSKGLAPEKVFLAYYGVPKKEQQEIEGRPLHKEFDIPENKIIVAMVSYFYKPKRLLGQTRGLKGHEDFIDAMKLVTKKHPDVLPVIIGNAWDGAEQYEQQVHEYARKQLGGNVLFTGYRSDVYHLYRGIDVVVHPSHSENLGGAAESLMLGVPTIASNVGGFPDIVKDGETGLLCDAKNPAQLAEKICWAVENLEAMKQMAQEGKQQCLELLDLEHTAGQIKRIYDTIVPEKDEQ